MVLPRQRRGPSGPLDSDGESARFSRTAVFNVLESAQTVVLWDTLSYDTGDFVVGTAPFNGFVAPRTGFYLVGLFYLLTASVDEQLVGSVTIGATNLLVQAPLGSVAIEQSFVTTTGIIEATAGDLVQAQILVSNSGGTARDVGTPSNFWIIEIEDGA